MNFPSLYTLAIGLMTLTALPACGHSSPEPELRVQGNTVQSNTQMLQGKRDGDGDMAAIAADFLEQVDEYRQADRIPGLAVALVQGNDILLLEGLGDHDVDQGLPVTPHTLFHIGSTHKSMTALLVATLVDDGVVEWDSPAIALNPDFALRRPESTETVTLRHLLSMRSGIPDAAEDGIDWERFEAEDIFDYVAGVKLLGDPGETFSYSNLSTSLAGYLAVLAAEENGDFVSDSWYEGYDQLLRDRVLDPIGMTRSTIWASEARKDNNHSRSYVLNNGQPQVVAIADSEDMDWDPLAPSGSLKASLTDMTRYILTQLNGGVAPNGDRVVSAANLRETWQPRWGNYAMGWEVSTIQGIQVISHGGAYDNFVSLIGMIPSHDIGLVILANAEDAADLMDDTPSLLVDMLEN